MFMKYEYIFYKVSHMISYVYTLIWYMLYKFTYIYIHIIATYTSTTLVKTWVLGFRLASSTEQWLEERKFHSDCIYFLTTPFSILWKSEEFTTLFCVEPDKHSIITCEMNRLFFFSWKYMEMKLLGWIKGGQMLTYGELTLMSPFLK